MAFTILSASGSNLTDLTNLSTDVSLPVNYSLDTSKKFVICNHPEALKNDKVICRIILFPDFCFY